MPQDSAGEPLYKLFKAIKHQVEKGPVDAVQKKAKYTLNDTGLLGDDVEYAPLVSRAPPPPRAGETLQGPGPGRPRGVSSGELCALPWPLSAGRDEGTLGSAAPSCWARAAGEARLPAGVQRGPPGPPLAPHPLPLTPQRRQ